MLLFAAFLTRDFQLLACDFDKIGRLPLPPGGREFRVRVETLRQFIPHPRVPCKCRFVGEIEYLTPIDALLKLLLVGHERCVLLC